jgi:hypothetical protein
MHANGNGNAAADDLFRVGKGLVSRFGAATGVENNCPRSRLRDRDPEFFNSDPNRALAIGAIEIADRADLELTYAARDRAVAVEVEYVRLTSLQLISSLPVFGTGRASRSSSSSARMTSRISASSPANNVSWIGKPAARAVVTAA